MDIFSLLQENIKSALKNVYDIEAENVRIEHPENQDFGDFATSLPLNLAGTLKQSPMEIAKSLVYELQSMDINFGREGAAYPVFEKIEPALPGFINFKLSSAWLQNVLNTVAEDPSGYGSSAKGRGRTAIVEFSQPNTNKPLHIGHARNNFLGSSIANILKFSGYKVIRSNYVGDIGIHICKSMLMYQKYGNNADPDKKSDHFVGDFYIMFERESENNPELLKEAQAMLQKWEAGDPQILALWEKMNNWAYKGWEQTYKDENVTFDVWEYESKSINVGKEIAEYAVEVGLAEHDETGAIIARLEKYGLPDKVLLRSDGTSIYSTKDLQLAKDSYERYNFDQRLYVVDYRQSDYFKQIFTILKLLGFSWADKLHHVSYGTVALPEGNMSSRKGIVVNADDVYNRLVEIERDEVRNSVKEVQIAETTAKKIALAAFRYAMLKVNPSQNIVFDYTSVTRFDGNTGPYLMYTYARTLNLLEKAGGSAAVAVLSYDLSEKRISDPKEEALLRELYKFPEIVENAAEGHDPSIVAGYLFLLSQKFNAMYASLPIAAAEDRGIRQFRLLLTSAVGQVLKNGLELLGIEVVERM
jgi:arginyl-tRNA synthetase